MAYQHKQKVSPPSGSAHYTNKSPDTTALNTARDALLNAVHYRQNGQLQMTSGPSSPTFNGNYTNKLYIIYPANNPPGNDDVIRIGVDALCWDHNNASSVSMLWNSVNAGTVGPITSGATQAIGERPQGARVTASEEFAFNRSATSNFAYTRFEANGSTLSHITSYTVPRYTTNYQDDTHTTTPTPEFDQDFNLSDDTFNVAQPLRGNSGDYLSTDGSVGALAQHQDTAVDGYASMISSTMPCVFGWMHPAGLCVIGGTHATGYMYLFGDPTVSSVANVFELPIKGRALTSGDKALTLAMVARWDTGCKIKVTTGAGNGELTLSGSVTGTAPSFVVSTDIVDFDPAGDLLTIETYTPAGANLEIKTIALFQTEV